MDKLLSLIQILEICLTWYYRFWWSFSFSVASAFLDDSCAKLQDSVEPRVLLLVPSVPFCPVWTWWPVSLGTSCGRQSLGPCMDSKNILSYSLVPLGLYQKIFGNHLVSCLCRIHTGHQVTGLTICIVGWVVSVLRQTWFETLLVYVASGRGVMKPAGLAELLLSCWFQDIIGTFFPFPQSCGNFISGTWISLD